MVGIIKLLKRVLFQKLEIKVKYKVIYELFII